jgi:hypothetical protein
VAVIDGLVAGDHPERLGSSTPVQPGQLLGRVNPLFIIGSLVTGDDPEGFGTGSGVESGQLLGCVHAHVVVFVYGDVSFLYEVCSGIETDSLAGPGLAERTSRRQSLGAGAVSSRRAQLLSPVCRREPASSHGGTPDFSLEDYPLPRRNPVPSAACGGIWLHGPHTKLGTP